MVLPSATTPPGETSPHHRNSGTQADDRGPWSEHRAAAVKLCMVLGLLLCASAAGIELTTSSGRWPGFACLGVGVIQAAIALALHRDRLKPEWAAAVCTLSAVAAVVAGPLAWNSLPDHAGQPYAAELCLLMFVAAPLGMQAFGGTWNLAYTMAAGLSLFAMPALLNVAPPLDAFGIVGAALVTIALQASLWRHHSHRRHLADTTQDLNLIDPLSEAYQRAFFLPLLAQEVLRSTRMSISASIALVDIDHLARINLIHGSAAGDRAIRSVVERIRGASRSIDVVGRMSGATFAVLLPGSTLAQAGMVAERIRVQVERSPVYLPNGSRLSITVSVGVSQLREQKDTETLWLSRADTALHRAKAQGRNRTALDTAYFAPR